MQAWVPVFLDAVAGEAEDGLQLLSAMERSWFAARRAVAGRRRNSRATAAVDLMAATPLVSATSLAADMAVKNAASLLDGFRTAGLAVEVTHRSKRRLFGLAPLREAVAPPRRPMPGRGRGRPPMIAIEQDLPPPLPEPPLGPIERREFDYSQLDTAIAFADDTVRRVRRNLDALLAAGTPTAPSESSKQTTADGDGAAWRECLGSGRKRQDGAPRAAEPDDTCWLAGERWWLSTAPVPDTSP